MSSDNKSTTIHGNVTGTNIAIGGQAKVSITHNATTSDATNTQLNELKLLLQELEAALKQVPTEQSEDVELVQEYANEIAVEAEKDTPRKKKLEITGDNLRKAAENLLMVAPIAARIAQKLLLIG